MTSENTTQREEHRLLESILSTVKSIDHNVDEILDRLGDYFDDQRYRDTWYGGSDDHADKYAPY